MSAPLVLWEPFTENKYVHDKFHVPDAKPNYLQRTISYKGVVIWNYMFMYITYDCSLTSFNTLRPRQNGPLFPDDIFKRIFLNENIWISIQISLKFVPGGPMNNIPALVQIMAWRRPGDKPLSEPMMVRLPTHICVTRPQWVKFTLRKHVTDNAGLFMTIT